MQSRVWADTNQVGGDFRRQPATFDNPAKAIYFVLFFVIV